MKNTPISCYYGKVDYINSDDHLICLDKMLHMIEPLVDHYLYPDILTRLRYTKPSDVLTWGQVHANRFFSPIPREVEARLYHIHRPNLKRTYYNVWLLEHESGDYTVVSLPEENFVLPVDILEFNSVSVTRMPDDVLSAINIEVGTLDVMDDCIGITFKHYEKI